MIGTWKLKRIAQDIRASPVLIGGGPADATMLSRT